VVIYLTFDAAVVKEKGITFAIVSVDSFAVKDDLSINYTQRKYQLYFPFIPIILFIKDSINDPKYYGRKDIVELLTDVSYHQIPWKKYKV